MTLDDLARLVRDKVAAHELRALATVLESPRIIDIAVMSPSGASWLLRCADQPDEDDRSVLATILAQGPFVRAAIIYCRPSETEPETDEDLNRLIGIAVCEIERLSQHLADWKREDRDQ